jgi:type VI protein secretion system component VasF
MNDGREQAALEVLREIRDGQREIAGLLVKLHALSEAHYTQARATIDESVELQRAGLRRYRTVSLVAFTGIAACIAAIAYLVLRYF